MWDYNDVVMDHFRNPRNVGVIAEPDGVGQVGSMACGDALKLMFKLDPEGRIADVKFQTFGCASAIASSSALTEILKGKTLAEAERVTNRDIADYLGGLPEQKMHCSVMGRDALLVAIENYRKRQRGEPVEEGFKEASDITCVCFGVTRQEIVRAIQENDLTSVEQVTNYTKAGGGCGGCTDSIAHILEETRKARVQAEVQRPKPTRPRRLTTIQKLQLIQETIEREIRPRLQKDGGDLELVDLDGNTVYVSMRGTCAQCKVAEFTLKSVVQGKLREFVAPELLVVQAPQAECEEEPS
jgi:NifU-like protein